MQVHTVKIKTGRYPPAAGERNRKIPEESYIQTITFIKGEDTAE